MPILGALIGALIERLARMYMMWVGAQVATRMAVVTAIGVATAALWTSLVALAGAVPPIPQIPGLETALYAINSEALTGLIAGVAATEAVVAAYAYQRQVIEQLNR